MKIIDRLLLIAYVRSYLICLTSLLSLYVVIDLFTNLEDFAQHSDGLLTALKQIGTYYGYKVVQIFDRLCEAIVLLAAMFTVAWMQRSNELLPLLSAGVSTRRAIRPVLIGSILLTGVGVANQELLIPRIADALLADRDDPQGDKVLMVQGAYDGCGIHVEGHEARRRNLSVKPFFCTIPETPSTGLMHLTAQEACYLPPTTPGRYAGGWLLTGVTPATVEGAPPALEMIDPGKFFLRTADVDFDVLTRNRNWFVFASTQRLQMMLSRPDARRLAPLATLFHMRLTRPVLAILLVFLGLSLILRDQNRNIFIGTGLCLAMCAIFFAAIFACKQLGDSEYLSPALAAWLPVLFFGPLAFSLFDAIHT